MENKPHAVASRAVPNAGTCNGVLASDGVYGSAVAVGALVDISGAAVAGVAVPSGLAGIQILQTAAIPLPRTAWLFASVIALLCGMVRGVASAIKAWPDRRFSPGQRAWFPAQPACH